MQVSQLKKIIIHGHVLQSYTIQQNMGNWFNYARAKFFQSVFSNLFGQKCSVKKLGLMHENWNEEFDDDLVGVRKH